jgi:hypothetical protein
MNYYRQLDPIGITQQKDSLFDSSSLHIPIHQGALQYATEKGYVANIDSDLCQYFVKEKECTPERIAPLLAGRINMK